MMNRCLCVYHDGFRLGRRTFLARVGRARGRGFGLGLVLRREPARELVLTVGPWAASVGPMPGADPIGDGGGDRP